MARRAPLLVALVRSFGVWNALVILPDGSSVQNVWLFLLLYAGVYTHETLYRRKFFAVRQGQWIEHPLEASTLLLLRRPAAASLG